MLPWRPFPRAGQMSEMVHGALALAAWPLPHRGAHWTGKNRLAQALLLFLPPHRRRKKTFPKIPLE